MLHLLVMKDNGLPFYVGSAKSADALWRSMSAGWRRAVPHHAYVVAVRKARAAAENLHAPNAAVAHVGHFEVGIDNVFVQCDASKVK